MRSTLTPIVHQHLAAIDLGSNSFHLLVAEAQNGTLEFKDKHRAKTELAAGLDDNGNLKESAIQTALSCLKQFAEVVHSKPNIKVRALGTKTLRDASNIDVFLQAAEAILEHPIEVISGREEARLIYLGAARAIPQDASTQLVVDIGGGSTELILGENNYPKHLSSLNMGCVVFRQRFFANKLITADAMAQAQAAACAELLSIRQSYLTEPWQIAVASSGTAQTVTSVLSAMGLAPTHLITREALWQLKDIVIAEKHLDTLSLPGLEPERAAILPAGIAILCAVFSIFSLDEMHYVEGALREGILYDMQLRYGAHDPRETSINSLCQRFSLDNSATDTITQIAQNHVNAIGPHWPIATEQRYFLRWAIQVRELGLAAAKHKFEKHGAYFLQAAEIAGFSRQEQQSLAFLVEAQCGSFPVNSWKKLPETQQLTWAHTAIILRLALLHHLAEQYCELVLLETKSVFELHLNVVATKHSSCNTQALWTQLIEREIQALQGTPFKLSYDITSGACPSASAR